MKKQFILFLAALTAVPAFAANRGSIMRGGYGFLFPDANHFVNGGQLSMNRGTSLSTEYAKKDLAGVQGWGSSVVWANGKTGVGAGVDRMGTDLSAANSVDTLNVQAGASVAQDKVTVGAVYNRSLESVAANDGNLSAQMNISLGKPGQGFVVGVGAGTSLGGATKTQSGTAALGYAFNSGLMLEGAYNVLNWSDAQNNHSYTGSFVYNHASWYVSGQYNSATVAATSLDVGAGRLGVVWGSVDLSAAVTKGLYTGGDTSYGGTLRVVF
ncbi:MAG: hypothetical protein EBQ85_05335 [Proteobacteria bacterium]|nr:hypothetical protein [Pseudomonadota bacterium]